MWTKKQILQHKIAVKNLTEIKNKVFDLINTEKSITEYQIQQFILQEYKKRKMITTDKPIVAFNESAASPHFCPKTKSKKLEKNNLILIDLWAKLNISKAPYADLTWVTHNGKPSKKLNDVFKIVIKARDEALKFIQKNLKKKILPTGFEINEVTNQVIIKAGYKKHIKHSTGHSIGTVSPHGVYGAISRRNKNPIKLNLGYTIEPGIYIDKKFGIRSEIDFYIDENYKLIITSEMQNKLY
ncbi:MAG: M24 family metallopeptidase [Candidatus Woesearchaeota archaeon]